MNNNKISLRDKIRLYKSLLPTPFRYYQAQFPDLSFSQKQWVSVKCCFHKDKCPSLRLHLETGAFRCFACGAKGSSLVAFHCQRYDMTFREAMKILGGWS